jgi:hypothetical protein
MINFRRKEFIVRRSYRDRERPCLSSVQLNGRGQFVPAGSELDAPDVAVTERSRLQIQGDGSSSGRRILTVIVGPIRSRSCWSRTDSTTSTGDPATGRDGDNRRAMDAC